MNKRFLKYVILCSMVLLVVFSLCLIYTTLIRDILRNEYSYGNFLALAIIAFLLLFNGIILLLLERYLLRVRPKVTELIAIIKIAITAPDNAAVSKAIIPSLYWKYIKTIARTQTKSRIAPTNRITFLKSSQKFIRFSLGNTVRSFALNFYLWVFSVQLLRDLASLFFSEKTHFLHLLEV